MHYVMLHDCGNENIKSTGVQSKKKPDTFLSQNLNEDCYHGKSTNDTN